MDSPEVGPEAMVVTKTAIADTWEPLGLTRGILRTRVCAPAEEEPARSIMSRASEGTPGMVVAANVHMVMEAWDDLEFSALLNSADLVLPDGMPLVWGLRLLGLPDAVRHRGPELMLEICAAAPGRGISVGLYGGTDTTLGLLHGVLLSRWKNLDIAYAVAPPFRTLTDEEDAAVCEAIRDAGVQVLFVGLGCPKQEKWMAAHRDRLSCVMIGVGAAFDQHAGQTRVAPKWMQDAGMEWLFRLCTEPRRLWKRYLKHNPRFVALFALQYVGYLLGGRRTTV